MATIDWNGLLRLPGAPDRNFEHFTYELVRRHYGRFGRLSYPSNAAGVEFILELDEDCEELGRKGQVVAWQCKWYFPNARLNATRKRDISDSYTRALARQPRPNVWYLCTPVPFTGAEDRWLRSLEMEVGIRQWHEPDYEGLTSPPYDVVASAWTGRLVLAPEWLADHVKRATTRLQAKYVPGLHVPTEIEAALRSAVGDKAARSLTADLSDQLESVRTRLTQVREPYASGTLAEGLAATPELTARLVGIIDGVGESVERLLQVAEEMASRLSKGRVSLVAELINDIESIPKDVGTEFWPAISETLSDHEEERRAREQAQRVIDVFDDAWIIRQRLLHLAEPLSFPIVAVYGHAGRGKSNLAAFAAGGFGDGAPCAAFVHGMDFGHNFSLEDIPQRAGMPTASLQGLLEALQAAGVASGKRALLVIDALNESADPAEWSDRLAELITAVERCPEVLAVVTFKTSYRSAVSPTRAVPTLRVPGFGPELEAAVDRYFEYYRIRVRGKRGTLSYFQDPLLLRIFCETRNPDPQEEVEVDLQRLSRFELFAEYLEERERRISAKRGEDPRAHGIINGLTAIASQMWDSNSRWVSAMQAKTACGDEPRVWTGSLLRELLAESLLLDRDVDASSGEVVFFPYDAMAGYVIGLELLRRAGGVSGRVIEDPEVVRKLVSTDEDRHPLGEDILAAVAFLTAKHGTHLFDISTEPAFCRAGLEALSALPLGHPVPASAARALCDWWATSNDSRHRRAVLQVVSAFALEPNHPLNFVTIQSLIRPLSISDRDLSWGEYARRHAPEILDELARIEDEERRDPHATIDGAECRTLWATWLLTSVDHEVRDRATRFLYWFGRRSPEALFALATDSLEINDPWIPERSLAACYGVAMARAFDREPSSAAAIGKLATDLADRMFRPGAPHAVSHRLTRDYGRWVLYLGHLIGAFEPEAPAPPFLSASQPWGSIDDKSKYYDEVAGAMQMDFENYTVGRLVEGRSNYDMDHVGYKGILDAIRWRIWDLGYRTSVFGDIDREIAESRWRGSEREGRVDRYGKKYSWIAFHEMEGRLEGAGAFPARDWEDGHGPDADIDPSFPEPPGVLDLGLGSWLGPDVADDLTWLRADEHAIPDSVLLMPEIEGASGPWVLAWGQIWEDGQIPGRRVYALMPGGLVPRSALEAVATDLLTKDFPGRWILGEPPGNHYIYAGEIPWSPLYDPTEGGVDEEHEPARMLAAEYAWESYHCILNQAGGALVPRRSLGVEFGLRMRPQTFDLDDSEGHLASICRRPAPPWDGFLMYLRADLLVKRLEETDAELVWIAWGERELIGDRRKVRDEAVISLYQERANLHRTVRMFDRHDLRVAPVIPLPDPPRAARAS
jgi:hypothetical protein